MSLIRTAFAVLLLALVLPGRFAVAAPKDELHDAFAKFLNATSFRASVTDMKKNEAVSSMEFVAPDRYRIKTVHGPTQYIVGDVMYMDMNGKPMRMPVPGVGKMVAQYRNADFLADIEQGMSVQALPDETVDGEAAKVYAYSLTKPVKSDAKTWVSQKSGLPIQVESTGSFMGHSATTRVRYSDFNDASIKIDLPD